MIVHPVVVRDGLPNCQTKMNYGIQALYTFIRNQCLPVAAAELFIAMELESLDREDPGEGLGKRLSPFQTDPSGIEDRALSS